MPKATLWGQGHVFRGRQLGIKRLKVMGPRWWGVTSPEFLHLGKALPHHPCLKISNSFPGLFSLSQDKC